MTKRAQRAVRLRNLDLIAAMACAVTNVLWALLGGRIPLVGIMLALPLVFLVPGYATSQVLFHNRSLNASYRLLFSIGLSLTIAVLGGLILNVLPAGLQAKSWALWLGLLTVVFAALAGYLRRGGTSNGTRRARSRLGISPALLFALALLLALCACLYAAVGAVSQPYPGFTQLWLIPQVQAGKGCAVSLGVRSFEGAPVTYRITMTVAGGEKTSWPAVVLASQQEWTRLVQIPPTAAAPVSVEAQLYRSDKPGTAYREVHATLQHCPRAKANGGDAHG